MIRAGSPTELTIYARNCRVCKIDKEVAAVFLSENHDFGGAKCRYRYGMFVERTTGAGESGIEPGTLVAVSEFSNARRMRDGSRSYEWIRYASIKNLRIIGGMGKMLDHFVEEVHPDDVMSYANAMLSDGNAYIKLGFVFEGRKEMPEGGASLKFRKRFSESVKN